jgi:hypothetical protein
MVLDMHHVKVVADLVALRTAKETDARLGGVGHLVFADEGQNIPVVSGHDKARTRVKGDGGEVAGGVATWNGPYSRRIATASAARSSAGPGSGGDARTAAKERP